jgi:hypothetical protein
MLISTEPVAPARTAQSTRKPEWRDLPLGAKLVQFLARLGDANAIALLREAETELKGE